MRATLAARYARYEAQVILHNIAFAASRGWRGSFMPTLLQDVAAICRLEAFR